MVTTIIVITEEKQDVPLEGDAPLYWKVLQSEKVHKLYVVIIPDDRSCRSCVNMLLQDNQPLRINDGKDVDVEVPISQRNLLIIHHFGKQRKLSFNNTPYPGTPGWVIRLTENPCIGAVGSHTEWDIIRSLFDPEEWPGACRELQGYLDQLKCEAVRKIGGA